MAVSDVTRHLRVLGVDQAMFIVAVDSGLKIVLAPTTAKLT